MGVTLTRGIGSIKEYWGGTARHETPTGTLVVVTIHSQGRPSEKDTPSAERNWTNRDADRTYRVEDEWS
jgi:hypothetical protein